MKRSSYLVGIALLVCGCASEPGEPTRGSETRQPSKSMIVCKRESKVGTRVPRKVCRTRSQIESEEEVERRKLEQMRRDTKSGPGVL